MQSVGHSDDLIGCPTTVIEAEGAISSILIMADLWLFFIPFLMRSLGARLQGWVLYRLHN
jgi:hypothetical protein